MGKDGKTYEIAIYTQTLVKIVDAETNLPLPSNVIKYPEEIQQGVRMRTSY